MTNDDSVKQKILNLLSEEPPMVLSTAYVYAKNYVNYGEDITKAWTTAMQQVSILEKARQQAWVEAYDSFKADYENRLKADMVAIFDKIRAEIKALSPEPTAEDVIDGNPTKDAIWETLADVLLVIDKYKAESEG